MNRGTLEELGDEVISSSADDLDKNLVCKSGAEYHKQILEWRS